MYVCMYVCMYVSMCVSMHVCMSYMYVCMYECLSVCMYVYIHMCMYTMYVMYAYNVCMYVYMYVCMCVCMDIGTSGNQGSQGRCLGRTSLHSSLEKLRDWPPLRYKYTCCKSAKLYSASPYCIPLKVSRAGGTLPCGRGGRPKHVLARSGAKLARWTANFIGYSLSCTVYNNGTEPSHEHLQERTNIQYRQKCACLQFGPDARSSSKQPYRSMCVGPAC